jgi:ribosome maturation factor RimP
VKQELEAVVRKELDSLGFELVDLRKGGTRNQPTIELRIDRPDGEPISVDDCARASRAVEGRLDGGDLVPENYVLQVSSPGERPLRSAEEWRRFIGRWASVSGSAVGGRVEGKIVDVEGDAGAEVVHLEDARGKLIRIPLIGVTEGRLAFRL